MDRFVPVAERFIAGVFGREFFDGSSDLKDVVEQVTATAPIALSSSPGFDASYKVDALVERMHATCANIAMGSNEGLESADKAISNTAAAGSWVIVKNPIKSITCAVESADRHLCTWRRLVACRKHQ